MQYETFSVDFDLLTETVARLISYSGDTNEAALEACKQIGVGLVVLKIAEVDPDDQKRIVEELWDKSSKVANSLMKFAGVVNG